jgi:hypothetical protein
MKLFKKKANFKDRIRKTEGGGRKTENLKNWGQISAKLPHPAGMGMVKGNTIEDFLFIDTQILRCPARDALRRAQNDSTVFFAEWRGIRQLSRVLYKSGYFLQNEPNPASSATMPDKFFRIA